MSGTEQERVTYYEFVNEKLWLLTEQPTGWREKLDTLESRYIGTRTDR